VSTKDRLDIGSTTLADRLQAGDRFAPPHYRELLTSMLDSIEQVGEAPGCVGCRDLTHRDQIIRYRPTSARRRKAAITGRTDNRRYTGDPLKSSSPSPA